MHFLVNAPGHEPLVTHVFVEGDKYIDTDVVFGVKDELIAKVEKRTDPTMPDGKPADVALASHDLRFSAEAGSGRCAEADGHGGRREVTAPLKSPAFERACSFIVRRTRIERIANFEGARLPSARRSRSLSNLL